MKTATTFSRATKGGLTGRLARIFAGLGLMMLAAGASASAQLPTHELPGLKPPAAREPVAPIMSDKSHYSEYWEQIFLMDDGTLFTSQFTIANFPFSKHRGLMLSTLVWPDGKTVVIKNGRSRKGWDYDAVNHQLKIYQHTLKPTEDGYALHLHNTAAEARMDFQPMAEPLTFLKWEAGKSDYGVTYYAPEATAKVSWRPGPEIDGPGDDGPWMALGSGTGFGVHVIQTDSLENMFSSWMRALPLGKTDGDRPVFNWMVKPGGKAVAQLSLIDSKGQLITLTDVQFDADKDGNVWHVRAKGNGVALKGAYRLEKSVDTFALGDHLTAIEKMAAGTLAQLKRQRYQASYDFTLSRKGHKTALKGRALAEILKLDAGKETVSKKRRIRR
ncbi:hypothetical protein [Kordiimonas marina]|uniref:hypothetical protein n=1 Tax=Kordiimonas marina TaxID=2872312 RepID=UPI001FF537CE|nr:hypothetical protein [Kordiimonas marina]MCJ9429630.1 hypothetical protein [Kordiimonas marina]